MKRLFLVLVLLWPALAGAEDIKRADGTILKGTILRAEPDGLVVETESGIQKVDFLLLADEVQKRYGFDFAKSREYRASQAAAQQQLVQQQAAEIRAQAAALEEKQKQQPTPEEEAKRLKIEQTAIFATAMVQQGMSKGVRASLTVMTGHAAATGLDKDTRATKSLGGAFIYGLERAAGEAWQGKLFPAGYYHYTTSFGEEMTLKAYALNVDDALAHGADGTAPIIPSVDPAAAQRQLPGGLKGVTSLDRKR